MNDSGSPLYRGFQPIPDGLSNRQRDNHLQDCLRSAFVLIAELQKTVTELTLQNLRSATSPTVSTPSTTLGTPSTVRMASTPGKLAGSPRISSLASSRLVLRRRLATNSASVLAVLAPTNLSWVRRNICRRPESQSLLRARCQCHRRCRLRAQRRCRRLAR